MSEKIGAFISKNVKWIFLAFCVVVGAGTVYYVLDQREAEKEEIFAQESLSETPITVTVEKPKKRDLAQISRYIGTSEADRTVYVLPKVSGEITKTYFKEGDHVKAGALLFTIDDTTAKLTLEQAEAALKSAEAGLSAAEAGYRAQEAPNSAAHVAAEETLAGIDTNSRQLQMATDSAEAQANQASLAEGSATESYEFYIEQANDAWDKVDELLENKTKAEKALSDATSAAEDAAETLTGLKTLKYTADNAISEGAKTAILASGGFNSIAALNDAIDMATLAYQGANTGVQGAQTAYASAVSAYESAKSAAQQLDLQVTAAENSAESASMSAQTADEAAGLSRQQAKDFDDYTKDTIKAQTNAQVAASDEQLNAAGAQVDMSGAGVEQAETGVKNAKLALEYCSVKSPISGVISAFSVKVHDMASPGQVAVTIIGDAQGKVVFYVAEKTVNEIKIGDKVTLEKDGEEHDGIVTMISDVADQQRGLYKVEAQTTDGTDFKPNSSIGVNAISRQSEDALVVKTESVYYDGQQAFVYLEEDGVAKRRDVTTGLSDDKYVEITDGLKKSDRVITGWSSRLKDGSLVKEESEEK